MKKKYPVALTLVCLLLATALWAAASYKFPGDLILDDGSGASPKLKLVETGGTTFDLYSSGSQIITLESNKASDTNLFLNNAGAGHFNVEVAGGDLIADGRVWGRTRMEIGSPGSTDCIVRLAGGLLADTDCDGLEDAGELLLVDTSVAHTRCVNIDPNHTTTNWLFVRANEAWTLTGIDCLVDAATSVVLTLRECDSNGGSCADSEAAITCNATNSTEAGGIDDTAVDAGDWLRVTRGTVTGSPLQAELCVSYTVVG